MTDHPEAPDHIKEVTNGTERKVRENERVY